MVKPRARDTILTVIAVWGPLKPSNLSMSCYISEHIDGLCQPVKIVSHRNMPYWTSLISNTETDLFFQNVCVSGALPILFWCHKIAKVPVAIKSVIKYKHSRTFIYASLLLQEQRDSKYHAQKVGDSPQFTSILSHQDYHPVHFKHFCPHQTQAQTASII